MLAPFMIPHISIISMVRISDDHLSSAINSNSSVSAYSRSSHTVTTQSISLQDFKRTAIVSWQALLAGPPCYHHHGVAGEAGVIPSTYRAAPGLRISTEPTRKMPGMSKVIG